jgi:hypothetical protein
MTPNQKAVLMDVKQLLFCALDGLTDEELLQGATVIVEYQGDEYGFTTDGVESVDEVMTTIERASRAFDLAYIP